VADAGERDSRIFSLGRKARGTDVGMGASAGLLYAARTLTSAEIGKGVEIPEVSPSAEAYSPYGAMWKEFDKLQKAAKNNGLASLTHWWAGSIPGILSLFDPHKHARPFERALFAGALIIGLATVVRARWAASRLAHWRCPRCRSEWPGKKLEKEPRCAICGLKLHQLAP
jgi:hypothetical protein